MPDLLASLGTAPQKGRLAAWKPTNCTSVLAPAFCCFTRGARLNVRRVTVEQAAIKVPLPCVAEGEDQRVLGDDKGSKNSTLAAPLVSQVVACVVV